MGLPIMSDDEFRVFSRLVCAALNKRLKLHAAWSGLYGVPMPITPLETNRLCCELGMESIDLERLTYVEKLVRCAGVLERRRKAETPKAASPADGETMSATQIHVMMGAESAQILTIARSAKTADRRMREIYEVDRRCLGWKSTVWAQLLNVKSPAIRQTDFWKVDRQRLTEEHAGEYAP